MTTYNTLNPMPSSAPKDLYDNAQVIDEYANSELPSTTDRFGRRRYTIAGMEAQFQDALANTGFEFIGNYDDPGELTFTRRNQVMLKDGAYWSPAAETVIPVTTTGDWVADQPKFVMRGDSTLKADLASSSGALGVSLVNGAIRTVASIAALRALPKTGSPVVFVHEYYAGVRGGGGHFRVDLSDLVTVADNGMVFVADDGARWKRIVDRPVTAQDYGCDVTGVTDAVPQLQLYQASFSEIIFTQGQLKIDSPITFGPGKNVTFETNASVLVGAAGSVSFQGAFHSVGFGRLFYGTGAVTGIRSVWPEWWGALGNGTGNDQPAFQLANNCLLGASPSQGGPLKLNTMGRVYQFAAPFAFQPSATANIHFLGAGSGAIGGTRLRASPAFSAGAVFYLLGQPPGAEQAMDFVVRDFRIEHNPAGDGGAVTGFQVGTPVTNYRTEGFHCNVIENVIVTDLPVCWDIVHARLIDFNRCSAWNTSIAGVSTGWQIRQVGNFTGDLRFNNCQFVSQEAISGNTSLKIISNTGLSTGAPFNMIAGIKFNECDFYQADKKVMLYAGNGSRIADIWFTNCQWDGNSNQDIYLEANGTSSLIDDIHFLECYVAGGNLNPALDQMIALINGGGKISGVTITGGNWQLAQGKTMNFQGVEGIVVDGVQIRDNNNQTGPAIEFNACTNFTCTGNQQARVTTNFSKYMIQVGATCNRFIAAQNNGGGIPSTAVLNDLTGAVTKITTPNI